jgi:hypothetical protein
MRRLTAAMLIVTTWACASSGRKPVFHRARATYSQALDLSGVSRVVVRSSLPQEQLHVVVSQTQSLLSGVMEYRIGGYHGSRKDAGVGPVAPASLVFDEERLGATLTLSSREWQHMHHSTLHTQVTIVVPGGIEVIAQPYSYSELEK